MVGDKDAGYTSKLELDKNKYDALSSNISFRREKDDKGRPSSLIMGGTMDFSVEITEENTLDETMINGQNQPNKEGTLSFFQSGTEEAMRKFVFKKAYIVNYSESFSAGGSPYTCSFQISAETITIDDADFDQRWPDKS